MEWIRGEGLGGTGAQERERAGVVRTELTCKSERESDFNIVGPKRLTQIRPVRPVAPTGQTGLAHLTRTNFGLVIYPVISGTNDHD